MVYVGSSTQDFEGVMELIVQACLVQMLLYCASQTAGLTVVTNPWIFDGVVQTELNRTVSLTCKSEDSGSELLWLRNDASVLTTEGNRLGQSSLCVTPVTRDDHLATFICQLKADSSSNVSVTLNVTYAPVHSGTEEVSVEEEGALVLQCDVRAIPPVLVSWQLNGASVDLSLGGFVAANDGITARLSVNIVRRPLHQGAYECVTTSTVYGSSTKSFQVTVDDKTLKFPLMPMIAGLVVVFFTTLLAIVSRWKRIMKCFK
ncbi:transmembrane and immunoglobulin domain-containing protein 1 [Aplochiton taeniatus]